MSAVSDPRLIRPVMIGDVAVRRVEDGAPIACPFQELFPNGDWLDSLGRTPWLQPAQYLPDGRLLLSFNSYVVSLGTVNVLVDSGIGYEKDRGDYPDYSRRRTDFIERLAAVGVAAGDIDYVVCTHLHPDHVGWNTVWRGGQWEPTFQNATYVFSELECDLLADRWRRGERDGWAMAAWSDSIAPILGFGRAISWTKARELLPGLQILSAAGHSPDQMCIKIASQGQTGLFSADVIHHVVQIGCPHLHPCYDRDEAVAADVRHRLIEDAIESRATVFPAHFSGTAVGHICRGATGPYVEFLE
jgi:glyoxylase-like metal-dependent hydrolase (beta-lactamase superfamily II)